MRGNINKRHTNPEAHGKERRQNGGIEQWDSFQIKGIGNRGCKVKEKAEHYQGPSALAIAKLSASPSGIASIA